MVRKRKSKNDITKYVIIGIVVLVLLFLVMNVNPTGKYADTPGQEVLNEGEVRSGEDTEKQGELKTDFGEGMPEKESEEASAQSVPQGAGSQVPPAHIVMNNIYIAIQDGPNSISQVFSPPVASTDNCNTACQTVGKDCSIALDYQTTQQSATFEVIQCDFGVSQFGNVVLNTGWTHSIWCRCE